jgi:hypothetical protein
VQIVNFSAAGYSPLQKLAVSEMRVPEYHPDIVVYAANFHEREWTFFHVEDLAKRGMLDEYPFVSAALRQQGFDPQHLPSQAQIERTMAARSLTVLEDILTRFVADVRGMGAKPVLLLLELPGNEQRPAEFDELAAMGRKVGCEIVDLYGALGSVADRSTLAIAPWDDHSNATGHRLLGTKLAAMLVAQNLVHRSAGSGAGSGSGTGSAPPGQ